MSNHPFDFAIKYDFGWKVNGVFCEGNVETFLESKFENGIDDSEAENCPYCGKPFQHRYFERDEDVLFEEETGIAFFKYIFQTCSYCSHWELTGFEGGRGCMYDSQTIVAAGVKAKFSTQFPHGCSEELAQHLRRNPELWHRLSPLRMETLVADIFRSNFSHSEVLHVGSPGDRGVDVVFIESSGVKWLIQVKRRENPKKAESFSTLQSILGTMALTGERNGIIVSTSDSFSFQARREVANAKSQGFLVELVDKGKLNRMIEPLLPRTPWLSILAHPDLVNLRREFNTPIEETREHRFYQFLDPNQLSLF